MNFELKPKDSTALIASLFCKTALLKLSPTSNSLKAFFHARSWIGMEALLLRSNIPPN